MGFGTLLAVAAALSMDAFAVSVGKGLALRNITLGKAALVGLWFGGFQALMPLAGYFLGAQFRNVITALDHWVVFGLLLLIGGNMLWEALSPLKRRAGETEVPDGALSFRKMLPLAVATSIDALAIGITFAFLRVEIFTAVTLIGVITFLLSMAGVKIGSIFGMRYKTGAEVAGGVILIALGTKILLEHLGVL